MSDQSPSPVSETDPYNFWGQVTDGGGERGVQMEEEEETHALASTTHALDSTTHALASTTHALASTTHTLASIHNSCLE
ncbi:hypothetical protein Pmani_035842 [Petrolisthes manimaculis]|uniref:Uncharacterized protein n=1 Tax=Petrolisthes manimaculis TaxID=1843537 RepID=A0AAE1NLH7_9EUCA|nr:hypothetical protein Pmani_035842 [Petrolisthes manimaculis]